MDAQTNRRSILQRNAVLIAVVICVIAVAISYEERRSRKPVKTSVLRRDTFIRELLTHENETPFREMFRLKRSTFHRLCSDLAKVGLTPTREISIAEQSPYFSISQQTMQAVD
jgi:hypothetical protein